MKRKQDAEGCTTNHHEKDDEVFKTLKQKHGSSYDVPRLRLWYVLIYTMIQIPLPTYWHFQVVLLRSQNRIHSLMQ